MAFPNFLRALRSYNYRCYFLGQLVSMAGTWMQQIAMSWLAYRLTGSAALLGTIGFASQLPILLFGALGGVWSDRFDRRRVLLWTQSLSMIQALALALLTWKGWINAPLLVLLAFGLGCINALDMPARQSIAVKLVDDKDDLPNAIALNSFMMNSTRFVGPALAGFLIALTGEVVCFLLNALSYLAVILALLAMHWRPLPVQGERQETWAALRQGVDYCRGHRPIRSLLLIVAAVSFFITPYGVLMPLVTREIFGGDARIFGLLVGFGGVGALGASLYLASRAGVDELPRTLAFSVPLAGVALTAFILSPSLFLAYPAVMLLGFCTIVTVAGSNTLIQFHVSDALRGRVMALFSIAFLGVAPLGSLAIGLVAEALGVRITLAACGLLILAGCLIWGRRLGREVECLPPQA
ncbi:MFS transporter [Azospira inquinata]|uniref:MFS transporter n=1 Tax=Azospira inquinata TaxID=2785627 RepID=A0A975SKV3_9RHOO|nr:MFS transporter [Azospira inquinata]QWT46547.1 MFS transporter [Azospira inquinata]QWT48128.1 MFS transporter [Azospira inquinata]